MGLGRTGRLVTSAAAILMMSFLSMSTGPQTDLKILATGLGAGILIDAVVIRCLLVPAIVALAADIVNCGSLGGGEASCCRVRVRRG